jgi:hypothetical protein
VPQKQRFSQDAPQKPRTTHKVNIIGHLYGVGQRVYRRQNASALTTFGAPRYGTIVDLTWKEQNNGFYPSYAVKFDNSSVVDPTVLQMRLRPVDS